MKTLITAALAGVAMASFATPALATDFSFAGTFLTDDGKARFDFSLASASTVTIRSFGYAGGMNAAGQTIAAGGFDSVLTLYDNSGQVITFIDPNGQLVAFADDDVTADPLLTLGLGAGNYSVYLTQYGNPGPANLALPFNFDGQPNFAGGFVDFFGSQRTGNWALDITNVTTAAVPEAGTWALMLLGFGAAGVAMRSRRRVTVSFG